MSFHSWLQNLRSALATGRGHRHHVPRCSLRTTSHRLNVEALESRITPSFTYYGAYPAEEVSGVTESGYEVTADFNRDGSLDRFTMFSEENIYLLGFVYLNRGDGTYDLQGSGYAGSGYDYYPSWIATGDLDVPGVLLSDGFPDLAIHNWPNDITIFRNNGDWPNSPKLWIGGASVTEGNTGVVEAVFTVTLENGPAQPVSVQYSAADGSATAGNDYQPASGTLTFEPGETSKTITVLVNGDRVPEVDDEYFVVNFSDPTNAVLMNNQGWGSILDDEPRFGIGDATVVEGNTGTASANFTVVLDAASTEPLTVAYASADGSATAGSDYQAASATITFAPGETSKTITVLVNGDRLGEANETFYMELSDPTISGITYGVGVGTIVDDEPRISIGDAVVTEGNAGAAITTFTLTLSQPSDLDVTVHFTTANITAEAGSDYIAVSGVVTIPAGQTSRTFTVAVNGDRLPEPKETFVVNLSNPTNAVIADGQGVGTIVDNEPRISIGDVTKMEKRNHTTLFTFTVTLSVAYDQPVTMSFQTVNGTATTSDGDYVAKAGTLTFAPGETTKTITIEVKGDSKKEADETFYLDLSGLSSNGLFTKNRGLGTILNDD